MKYRAFDTLLKPKQALQSMENKYVAYKQRRSDMKENLPQYNDDDGTEVNPDIVPKPSLCISCNKDELGHEEVLCDLTRMDQHGNNEFICEAYEPKDQE
jgi:hypothetical protein